MSITINGFARFDSDETGPMNAERVLRFLVRNREKAYKATENVIRPYDLSSLHVLLDAINTHGPSRRECWQRRLLIEGLDGSFGLFVTPKQEIPTCRPTAFRT